MNGEYLYNLAYRFWKTLDFVWDFLTFSIYIPIVDTSYSLLQLMVGAGMVFYLAFTLFKYVRDIVPDFDSVFPFPWQ